jgi:hypothetical protein
MPRSAFVTYDALNRFGVRRVKAVSIMLGADFQPGKIFERIISVGLSHA